MEVHKTLEMPELIETTPELIKEVQELPESLKRIYDHDVVGVHRGIVKRTQELQYDRNLYLRLLDNRIKEAQEDLSSATDDIKHVTWHLDCLILVINVIAFVVASLSGTFNTSAPAVVALLVISILYVVFRRCNVLNMHIVALHRLQVLQYLKSHKQQTRIDVKGAERDFDNFFFFYTEKIK